MQFACAAGIAAPQTLEKFQFGIGRSWRVAHSTTLCDQCRQYATRVAGDQARIWLRRRYCAGVADDPLGVVRSGRTRVAAGCKPNLASVRCWPKAGAQITRISLRDFYAKQRCFSRSATFTRMIRTGTSIRGPMTAANATGEPMPNAATATAIASSKLLPAAVNAIAVVRG